MNRTLLLLTALAILAAPTMVRAEDDDWEFQENPAQRTSVASVQYEGGQMIALQCREGALRLVMAGLPESSGQLSLGATRADGRRTEQIWVSGAPGAYRSASPGRDARFLRGGGAFSVRTEPGASTVINATFDLPTRSANLDRVLTACGWALEDDRDLLEEAYEVSLDRPRRNRAVQADSRRPYRAPAHPEREVSCIVRERRLTECRADHPPSARTSEVRSLLSAVRGKTVYVAEGVDPAVAEGKVFHAIASNMLLIVVTREPL